MSEIDVEWSRLQVGKLVTLTSAVSVAENVIMHPLWVLKTRDQTSVSKSKCAVASALFACSPPTSIARSPMFNVATLARQIVKQEVCIGGI